MISYYFTPLAKATISAGPLANATISDATPLAQLAKPTPAAKQEAKKAGTGAAAGAGASAKMTAPQTEGPTQALQPPAPAASSAAQSQIQSPQPLHKPCVFMYTKASELPKIDQRERTQMSDLFIEEVNALNIPGFRFSKTPAAGCHSGPCFERLIS